MERKIEEAHQQFGSEQIGFGLGFDDGSFTALLELPPPQAVELLVKEDFPAQPPPPPIFPSDIALVDRASRFSVFASACNNDSNSNTSDRGNNVIDDDNSAGNSIGADTVKQEPVDSDSNQSLKSGKRKVREKKVKEPSSRKSKKVTANESSDAGGDKLPYVHVRARRGQATDSHSLAERARREKINARMKLLQELVPGCNKISGTAMVLDEIINHVQALQRQVEFLSMRLATVNPRIDFNFDALLPADNGPIIDNSYSGMFVPPVWPGLQVDNGSRQEQLQQYEHPWHFEGIHQPTYGSSSRDEGEDASNFVTQETSLLSSYETSPYDSATLHSNQLKMEL